MATHLPCRGCGARVRATPLAPGQSLRCGRCGATVARSKSVEPFEPACAVACAGLCFLALANFSPIMTFEVAGNEQRNLIASGVRVLFLQGYWPIALMVAVCAIGAPFVYLLGAAYASASCLLARPLPFAGLAAAAARGAEPWSLVPVFALACFVAAFRLDLIGHVEWESGIGWVGLLTCCALALGSLFDPDDAARRIGRARP